MKIILNVKKIIFELKPIYKDFSIELEDGLMTQTVWVRPDNGFITPAP